MTKSPPPQIIQKIPRKMQGKFFQVWGLFCIFGNNFVLFGGEVVFFGAILILSLDYIRHTNRK
jgi:hypothetical protein